jgi:hypothetical protein
MNRSGDVLLEGMDQVLSHRSGDARQASRHPAPPS